MKITERMQQLALDYLTEKRDQLNAEISSIREMMGSKSAKLTRRGRKPGSVLKSTPADKERGRKYFVSQEHLTKKQSPEHRAHMSKAMKESWAKRRAAREAKL